MNDTVKAVQRMQNYIAAHLGEEITLAALSREAMYSPWYSYRLFVRYTNYTPADYIRRLRLSESAIKLRDGVCGVTEAAFALGFLSADGYTRAFRREFGMNPRDYAKNPQPLYLFTPFGVENNMNYNNESEETKMSDVKSVFIQVIDKPAHKVIVKRGVKAEEYWTYCEEVGCDVWGLLKSMKSLCGEPVCLWLPEKYIAPGTSRYVQGVEVNSDYNGIVPQGFDIIDLPAAKYLMFQGEPFDEADFGEAIETLWQAMLRYNPENIGYSWDDDNPRIQLEPIGTRGYIEMKAIKMK